MGLAMGGGGHGHSRQRILSVWRGRPEHSATVAALLARSTEVDLGLTYAGQRLQLDGQLYYSDFDNDEELLTWQNPYNAFGDRVAYAEGIGGLALAPESDRVGRAELVLDLDLVGHAAHRTHTDADGCSRT